MRIMKWIPNALSVFRFLVSVPVLHFASREVWTTSFVLIVLGYLSDLIDGPIARRYQAETVFGKNADLVADIVFDEGIVGGFAVAHQISSGLAALIALAVVVIRLPGFSNSQLVNWLWRIMMPVYAAGMIYLVGVCIVRAFGMQGLGYLLVVIIPLALAVARIKRERIIEDSKKFLTTFSSK